MQNLFKTLSLITGIFACIYTYAFDSNALEKQADSSITELYHKLNNKPNISMTGRIDLISKEFLNKPYVLGSLGEGSSARYDQYPRYRVDGFDCDTYVNTVVSLALANSLPSFQRCINHMRYTNGEVAYIKRTHFNGVDWNLYHQQEGLFKDITRSIKNKNNAPVARWAKTKIEKPQWYAFKTRATIRLQNASATEQTKRLAELKIKGSKLSTVLEILPYLPLSALFPEKNTPDMYLFNQIPHGAIIEIVRPNWDLRKEIGTALSISHLGFAIRSNSQLYFREASSEYGKVVDVPLIEYLQKAVNSPTIKGINVQIVVPQQPDMVDCKTSVSIDP